MEFAAWAVIGGALVINFLAFRARAGALTRQSWAGMRTRATMASDEAWSAAHSVAWPWMAAGAWIMALSGALALGASGTDDGAAAFLLGGIAVAVVSFAIGAIRGQSAARSVVEDAT